MVPALRARAGPRAPDSTLRPDRVHLRPGRAAGLLAGGGSGGALRQVRVSWHGPGRGRAAMGLQELPLLLVPARNGALSRSSLLVLLAGGCMGFSRELGSPEMVIIGRSITGLHSGGCCWALHGPFLTALCSQIFRGDGEGFIFPTGFVEGFSGTARATSEAMGSPLWVMLGMGRDGPRVWRGTLLPTASAIPTPPVPPRDLSQCGASLPGRNRPQEPAGIPGPHAQHLHLPGGFLCPGPGPPRTAGQGEHNTPAHTCWTLLCPPHDATHCNSSQDRFWPLFLSVVVVPASLQLLLLHCFPESPRYLLIERNDVCGATKGEGIS